MNKNIYMAQSNLFSLYLSFDRLGLSTVEHDKTNTLWDWAGRHCVPIMSLYIFNQSNLILGI